MVSNGMKCNGLLWDRRITFFLQLIDIHNPYCKRLNSCIEWHKFMAYIVCYGMEYIKFATCTHIFTAKEKNQRNIRINISLKILIFFYVFPFYSNSLLCFHFFHFSLSDKLFCYIQLICLDILTTLKLSLTYT